MTRPGKDKGIASPIPLGLAALGSTTFLLGFGIIFQAHSTWAPYFAQAVLFGGLIELLAGMWAFAYGDTLGATTFSFVGALYGWIGLATMNPMATQAIPPNGLYTISTGMVLVVSGFVIMYLWLSSFYESLAFNGALLCLWIALELVAIFEFTDFGIIGLIGGIFALISGLFAFYGSFAENYNATALQEMMPLGEPATIRERSELNEQERIRRHHHLESAHVTNGGMRV
jgi:succinate-acetate transporter protein